MDGLTRNPLEEYITGGDPNIAYCRLIGEGACGQVHVLETLSSRQLFARKTSQWLSESARTVIDTEARSIIRLASKAPHKNLIRIFDHGWLKSHTRQPPALLPIYFIDMELGQQSLDSYIRGRYWGPRPEIPLPAEVWGLSQQIASGLAFMHQKGVIHRDLKPDNIIQSSVNPNIWKITDFGISVIARSKHLLATNARRGTPQYTAPEISHAQPNIPSYQDAVDTWGLGLIFYELFTGKRMFEKEADALQFPPRIPLIHYWRQEPVSPAFPVVPEVSIAARIVSAPLDHIDNLARGHITIMWNAVKLMKKTEQRFIGAVNDFTIQSRLDEVNTLVGAMLNLDPMQRPSIEVLEHHFRVNVIRSMVENDVVYRTGAIDTLINAIPRSNAQSDDYYNRWQFIIDLESMCVGEDHCKLYNNLVRMAKRFLVEGPEDPNLKQELFLLLSMRYDLCDEFQRLYVSGQNLSDLEREKYEVELRYEDQNTTKHHFFVSPNFATTTQQYGAAVPQQFAVQPVNRQGVASPTNQIPVPGLKEPAGAALQTPVLHRGNSQHSDSGSEIRSVQQGNVRKVEQWVQGVGGPGGNFNVPNQPNLNPIGPQIQGQRQPARSQYSDWDVLSDHTASLNLGPK